MRISDWSSDVCSSDLFDGDIGGDLTQQPTRDQHTASPVALGERRRKRQPKLSGLAVLAVDRRELGSEQARRLFEAQAGGDEKIGEQRVAQPVAIASAGADRKSTRLNSRH